MRSLQALFIQDLGHSKCSLLSGLHFTKPLVGVTILLSFCNLLPVYSTLTNDADSLSDLKWTYGFEEHNAHYEVKFGCMILEVKENAD